MKLIYDLLNASIVTPLATELILKVNKNFEQYYNVDMSEIDPNHNWIFSKNYGTILKLNTELNTDYFIYSKLFFDLKSKNNIGITFSSKNNIIKPFYIISHDWSTTKVTAYTHYYKCNKCEISGSKIINSNNKYECIIPEIYSNLLGCNDIIIRNIIK